jgi:hypothetical protein
MYFLQLNCTKRRTDIQALPSSGLVGDKPIWSGNARHQRPRGSPANTLYIYIAASLQTPVALEGKGLNALDIPYLVPYLPAITHLNRIPCTILYSASNQRD